MGRAASGLAAFAFAFAVAAAFAVAGAVAGDIEAAGLVLLLYVALPLLNALADMVSLWITRGFLTKILARRPAMWWICAQMVIDLFLAALCLAGLIAALVGCLTFWGWASPATLPIDWRAYWAGVHADPRTGVALYVMALSTLVPTMVHLTAGLGAMWTQKSRILRDVATELDAQPALAVFSEAQISDMKQAIGRATAWGYARAAFVVGAGFVPLIWGAYALVL